MLVLIILSILCIIAGISLIVYNKYINKSTANYIPELIISPKLKTTQPTTTQPITTRPTSVKTS